MERKIRPPSPVGLKVLVRPVPGAQESSRSDSCHHEERQLWSKTGFKVQLCLSVLRWATSLKISYGVNNSNSWGFCEDYMK